MTTMEETTKTITAIVNTITSHSNANNMGSRFTTCFSYNKLTI